MRFLSHHHIKMFYRYGFQIFLVSALLYPILLLFSQIATAQNRINLTSSHEHPITRFAQITQAEITEIDPNLEDPYEPDDTSDQANPIAIQIDQGRVSKQLRTFHSATDVDWIYFPGLKQFHYYFYAEGDGNIRMSLFDAKGVNDIWRDQVIKNNYYDWHCPRNGYYTLKLEPVFTLTPVSPSDSVSPTDGNAFAYRFWMRAVPPSVITLSGGVYGRIINLDGKGINRIHISVKNGGVSREDITDSIGEIWEIPLEPSKIDGWFFIDGLYANNSYEIIITKEEDPNNYLVPPFMIDLSERNIERIQDIQISHPVEPPYDPNNILFDLEILYEIWQDAIDPNGILPKWLDTNDLDGFVNIEEFLNGTHPFLYSIECPLSPRLILLPFYLDDPYTADDFCVQFLNEWQSIWGYDKENKRWQYWDANAQGENFTLQYGTGYSIYKQTHRTIYQELQSEAPPVMPELNPGINICPIPRNFQGGPYSSYEFINDEDPNGVKSMSRYRNTQEGKGAWESTYMFFGRPAGKDFPLTPEDAYVIGVKQ